MPQACLVSETDGSPSAHGNADYSTQCTIQVPNLKTNQLWPQHMHKLGGEEEVRNRKGKDLTLV